MWHRLMLCAGRAASQPSCLQSVHTGPVRRPPDTRCLVITARHQVLPVRGEGQAPHRRIMGSAALKDVSRPADHTPKGQIGALVSLQMRA